jgi:hypothetical protein
LGVLLIAAPPVSHSAAAGCIGVDLPARVPPLTMEPVSVEPALGSFASQHVGAYAKTAGELLVGNERLAEEGRAAEVNARRDSLPSLEARRRLVKALICQAPRLAVMLG